MNDLDAPQGLHHLFAMLLLGDLGKAIAQLFDPAFFGVLAKAIFITIAILIAVSGLIVFLLSFLLPDTMTIPILGQITGFDTIISVASIPILLIASAFLMFPVAAIFVGLYVDDIANAVDRRHYPHLPPIAGPPFGTVMAEALRFGMSFVVVNSVALIAYLVFAPLAPFIFWIVNGYLIGREYFQQVAMRRMPVPAAHQLRRTFRWRVWSAGIIMAVPLSIPVINLLVPVVAIAAFTHTVERLRSQTV